MPASPAQRPAPAPTRTPATPAAEVLHARRTLLALYFLTGIAVATWLSRLPSITALLDLSSGELGSVLVVGSVGSLAMVLAAGALTNRWGSRRALVVAAVMFSAANVLVGLGPTIGSVPVLVVGILVSSSSYALSNVPMNLETVIIERGMGRSVVPQFHAAFSIGSMAGSLLGALASWAGLPVFAHFLVLSAVTLVIRLALVPQAVLPVPTSLARGVGPVAESRGGVRAAFGAWRERRTLIIGVIVLTGILAEGSANNWLTVAVVDGFEQTEAVAAVVLGVFTGSMTVARLLGTRAIDRFGRVRVLVASSASSLVGVLLFALGPSLVTAALGAVAWGLGAGLVFPIGVAAVSGDRARMAGRVSVLSTFGSAASIVAPPLLGAAGEVMGIRHALALIVGGFVVAIVLARHVEDDAPTLPAGDTHGADDADPADDVDHTAAVLDLAGDVAGAGTGTGAVRPASTPDRLQLEPCR